MYADVVPLCLRCTWCFAIFTQTSCCQNDKLKLKFIPEVVVRCSGSLTCLQLQNVNAHLNNVKL